MILQLSATVRYGKRRIAVIAVRRRRGERYHRALVSEGTMQRWYDDDELGKPTKFSSGIINRIAERHVREGEERTIAAAIANVTSHRKPGMDGPRRRTTALPADERVAQPA